MADRIVIVSCGKDKLSRRAPARELYTGRYFKACRAAAQVLEPDRWFILSAKHGLLRPDTEVGPYDVTYGQPGSVDAVYVGRQATKMGLFGAEVVVLAPKAYVRVCEKVWTPEVLRTPLRGLAIGEQLVILRRIARGLPVPAWGSGPGA